jgi:hypothetical protein
VKAFWLKLRKAPWFRRSVRTFLQAFVGLLIPGVLGFLHGLTDWAGSHGQTPFPDAGSLAYLAVSAIVAGVIAVVTGIWTKAEDVSGHALLRTLPPQAPGD